MLSTLQNHISGWSAVPCDQQLQEECAARVSDLRNIRDIIEWLRDIECPFRQEAMLRAFRRHWHNLERACDHIATYRTDDGYGLRCPEIDQTINSLIHLAQDRQTTDAFGSRVTKTDGFAVIEGDRGLCSPHHNLADCVGDPISNPPVPIVGKHPQPLKGGTQPTAALVAIKPQTSTTAQSTIAYDGCAARPDSFTRPAVIGLPAGATIDQSAQGRLCGNSPLTTHPSSQPTIMNVTIQGNANIFEAGSITGNQSITISCGASEPADIVAPVAEAEDSTLCTYIVQNTIKSMEEIEAEMKAAARQNARTLASYIRTALRLGYIDLRGDSAKEVFLTLKEHFGLSYQYRNWATYYA